MDQCWYPYDEYPGVVVASLWKAMDAVVLMVPIARVSLVLSVDKNQLLRVSQDFPWGDTALKLYENDYAFLLCFVYDFSRAAEVQGKDRERRNTYPSSSGHIIKGANGEMVYMRAVWEPVETVTVEVFTVTVKAVISTTLPDERWPSSSETLSFHQHNSLPQKGIRLQGDARMVILSPSQAFHRMVSGSQLRGNVSLKSQNIGWKLSGWMESAENTWLVITANVLPSSVSGEVFLVFLLATDLTHCSDGHSRNSEHIVMVAEMLSAKGA